MEEMLAHETEPELREEPIIYQLKNITFIVEPIFSKESKETFGIILLRLMKSDVENV